MTNMWPDNLVFQTLFYRARKALLHSHASCMKNALYSTTVNLTHVCMVACFIREICVLINSIAFLMAALHVLAMENAEYETYYKLLTGVVFGREINQE